MIRKGDGRTYGMPHIVEENCTDLTLSFQGDSPCNSEKPWLVGASRRPVRAGRQRQRQCLYRRGLLPARTFQGIVAVTVCCWPSAAVSTFIFNWLAGVALAMIQARLPCCSVR